MEILSYLLILRNLKACSVLVQAYLIGLVLTLETGQGIFRQLQSSSQTPEIVVIQEAPDYFRFDVNNYDGILNSGDNPNEMNLSPAYDTWVSYGGDKEEFYLHVIGNFTGFTKIQARFSDDCIFPVLTSTVNSLNSPDLMVDKSVPYFEINNTVLGFPAEQNSDSKIYRRFSNFDSLRSGSVNDIREQVIDFSNSTSKIDYFPMVFCAISRPNATKFEFEIKVMKKQYLYEKKIQDRFQSTGRSNVTYNLTYNSTLQLLAERISGNATVRFNVSSPEKVLLKVTYEIFGSKKSPPIIGNAFSIEPSDNLVISISNNDPLLGESVWLDIDYNHGASVVLSAGSIVGIVLGCVGGLIIAIILFIFRKRIFFCCSKNNDYNSQYANNLQKKVKSPGNYLTEDSKFQTNTVMLMTSTQGTYPDLTDNKDGFIFTETDGLTVGTNAKRVSTKPEIGVISTNTGMPLSNDFPLLVNDQENQKQIEGSPVLENGPTSNIHFENEDDIQIMRVYAHGDFASDYQKKSSNPRRNG